MKVEFRFEYTNLKLIYLLQQILLRMIIFNHQIRKMPLCKTD